jgi:hypothetical protein
MAYKQQRTLYLPPSPSMYPHGYYLIHHPPLMENPCLVQLLRFLPTTTLMKDMMRES